jgi:hypothetical protein
MVVSFAGLGSKTTLARTSSNCTSELQTHPLVREGAQHQETRSCQKIKLGSRWEPDTKRDWPTHLRSKINVNFNQLALPSLEFGDAKFDSGRS